MWSLTTAVLATGAVGCTVSSVRIRELPRPTEPVDVHSPVKVHLADGAVIVYRRGVRISHDSIIGAGVLYDLTRRDSLPVDRYATADVVAMEVFVNQADRVASTVLSGAAGIGGLLVFLGVLIALAFSGGGWM
jgi:hypothetical protein